MFMSHRFSLRPVQEKQYEEKEKRFFLGICERSKSKESGITEAVFLLIMNVNFQNSYPRIFNGIYRIGIIIICKKVQSKVMELYDIQVEDYIAILRNGIITCYELVVPQQINFLFIVQRPLSIIYLTVERSAISDNKIV